MTQTHVPLRPRAAVSFAVFRLFLSALAILAFTFTLSGAEAPKQTFDVPAGDASSTLKKIAQQAGQQVVYPAQELRGIKTTAVRGDYTLRDALDRMLADTGLVVTYDAQSSTFAVSKADPNVNRANAQNRGRPGKNQKIEGDAEGEKILKLDTFEVFGQKSLNMDIRRSRDDVQPYVIFDRATITSSGATNLEDFFKNRLPMSVTGNTFDRTDDAPTGPVSMVNLRGLGPGQTLILINGHRSANVFANSMVLQPNLNGIPLSAIERIEVLPTTASGIYGGGATGGVVNVILRQDYAGAELTVSYDNTFDTDSAIRTVDLSGGFSLGERTNLMLSASYTDANALLRIDRDELYRRGVDSIRANNPGFYPNGTTPPLGATPNIRSSTGAPLQLKALYGGTLLGASFTTVPHGFRGIALDGTAALVTNAGTYNLEQARTLQAGYRRLRDNPTNKSVHGTVRHKLFPALELFAEASASSTMSQRAASMLPTVFTLSGTAPNNPFQQALRVTVPNATPSEGEFSSNDRRTVTAGAIMQLPADWKAEADFTWSRSTNESASSPLTTGGEYAAVSSGALDVLRDTSAHPLDFSPFLYPTLRISPIDSTLKDCTLRAGGPTGLPGKPTISALLQWREEAVAEFTQTNDPATTFLFPARSQEILSGYMELRFPLVMPESARPGIYDLSVQFAGRWDDYKIDGATLGIMAGSGSPVEQFHNRTRSVNPTIGLRYQPVKDVTLRASYGTGFLPPTFQQIVPGVLSGYLGFFGITDPRRGNELVTFPGDIILGGNPGLRPEESKSWSAGVVFTPRRIPNFRLSVDYTRIDKKDNITFLTQDVILANEALLPGRITRAANLPGDPAGWPGPIIKIDSSYLNLARAMVEAFDIQADYNWTTEQFGRFNAFLVATVQTHFKTQLLPNSPLVENVGFRSGSTAVNIFGPTTTPLKHKWNAGLTWERRQWVFGWTARYFDSYSSSSAANQGNDGLVESQLYHDVFLRYRFGASIASPRLAGLLNRTEVTVGVRNVLNDKGPFDASGPLFSSVYADPRLASYYISIKKNF